jgi:hypothetical protein
MLERLGAAAKIQGIGRTSETQAAFGIEQGHAALARSRGHHRDIGRVGAKQ